MPKIKPSSGIATFAILMVGLAFAGPARADEGKLLATSGISDVEGAAGGGLATWAVISGYETNTGIGANVHATFIPLPNYTLYSPGVSVGLYNRVELSYTSEVFDTGSTGAKLGIGSGYIFREDVVGLKVRVLGDIVYDQDSLLPQIAVGAQYKHSDNQALVAALGAKQGDGVDFYVSATKLFLAQSVLVDTTLRFTKANQFGLLGFGSASNDSYQPEFEGSLAYLLSRNLAIGGEFRTKPNNLAFAKEQDVYDIFAAYFITKNVSATLAYVDLGNIATFKKQRGAFISLQAGF